MAAVTAGDWAAGLATVLLLAAIIWLGLPYVVRRPEQVMAAARRRLDRGDWRGAQATLARLRPRDSDSASPWRRSHRLLTGECQVAAADDALRARRFADAIGHYRDAAANLGLTEEEALRRVVEAMLAECRRLSVTDPTGTALPELLNLILESQGQCPEASFWLGLHSLRRGETAPAVAALTAAHGGLQMQKADTALYLGALALREGRAKEALRLLAEANKSAPNCPLVAWQLGAALLASGGDGHLATRALQKATGFDGFVRHLTDPNSLWIETLPSESWIRNLAVRSRTLRARFRCPLGFDDIRSDLSAARLALAEGLELSGRPAEAAPIFTDLLRADDSIAIRRGLGLALAGMGRYDDALPHLRSVSAAEQPPDRRTTGALAICLAHAGGDRVENLKAAIALIGRQPERRDAQWARQAGAVYAAARAAGTTVNAADIADLCRILIANDSADPQAAAIYDLMACRDGDSMPIEAAWLYTRAAEQHDVRLANDEEMLDRAFSDRPAMKRFFESREWDHASAERLYLERWAERRPGSFPTAPGTRYPEFAEGMLLANSRRLEGQGQPDLARAIAHLVLRLAPDSSAAHDRLAEIAFRRKRVDESIDWLMQWRRRQPDNCLPVARLALIERARGRSTEALAGLRHAIDLARGRRKAPLALIAAQVALAAGEPEEALKLVGECLTFDATNSGALAIQAALLWRLGNRHELARIVNPLAQCEAEDPWFHYLVAVAAYAASQDDLAIARAHGASISSDVGIDGTHLLGVLHWSRGNESQAVEALNRTMESGGGRAADHARALSGQMSWRAGAFADALKTWQAIPTTSLKSWGLDRVIPGTAFLAGVQALSAGRADEAAKWLKAATRFGFEHPDRGRLLAAAYLRGAAHANPETTISRLEDALTHAGANADVEWRLARLFRRAGRLADARRTLDRSGKESAGILHERGLIALAEGQIAIAERHFADAVRLDPNHAAACVNLLLVRLSLGRRDSAIESLPAAIEFAPTADLRRTFTLLQSLATPNAAPAGGWTTADENVMAELLRRLGRLDAIEPWLNALSEARPQSGVARSMQTQLLPLRAKLRIDRGDAAGALRLLGQHGQNASRLLRNLMGVAACLRQDFAGAVRHFQAALPHSAPDARVQQNLAIVYGWLGDADRSAEHWRRFLNHCIDQIPKPASMPDYHRRIATILEERLLAAAEQGT